MEIFGMVVQALSGLLLLMVGGARLSNPISNYAKNSGIKIENEVNLLNELRGTSAVMLLGGVFIGLGIFIPQLTFSSFVVGILIFIGFLIGRLVSMRADGKPNKLIIQGLVFEIILGVLNVVGLITVL